MLWSRTSVAAFVLASGVALASPISAQAQEWKGAYAGYGWGDNSVKYTPNDINMQAIAGGVGQLIVAAPALKQVDTASAV